MPIEHSDVGGDDYLARRVLIRARDRAPCIATFEPDLESGKGEIRSRTYSQRTS